jgi:hypothetical protein
MFDIVSYRMAVVADVEQRPDSAAPLNRATDLKRTT